MSHINKTENVNFVMEYIYNFMQINIDQYIKMNVEYHHLVDICITSGANKIPCPVYCHVLLVLLNHITQMMYSWF